MITPEILSAITKAVFDYLLEQTGLADQVRRKLGRDPVQQAFSRALGTAVQQLEEGHPESVANLFDIGFFRREGALTLAQFLIRDGRPDPSELTARWADSLSAHDPERRTSYTCELEPVAADFLESLAHALKAEPELADLHDSRALERLAEDVDAIRRRLGAEQATPGTHRDYLHWLIERNLYLDPRGTLQAQRQVQVKLDEVYISLRAQREETPGTVDRRLLEGELAELEARLTLGDLPAEEMEDRREQLLARFESLRLGATADVTGEVVELAEAVNGYDRLVILGDPGSGKTTLLRYLALKHAQALWDGRAEASAELGAARFPILMRIADYAEKNLWKKSSLSDFLGDHCVLHECPEAGLADLLRTELDRGNCLVLLDGLDEIVDADDRRGVVQRIEDFVRRHDSRPNRFIITSRIAGYRSTPLGEPFAHYTVQEMDEAQIRRFLECWCPAVEAAQTPDLSPEARQAVADRELDGVMKAIETSPGVRRLAANPLLLRTLALIHRAGAQLPQKRIELYKLAADTLTRTWRTAQGVPETALVDDRYVTRLLGKMAYWLHVHKPTGIATEREVYAVLGAEWARINRLVWNEDDPDPAILDEVEAFLRTVREHTGLFVERAPRRYGFMHLTFEEYYTARHLVARRRGVAQMIREHLHDPRWDEPILLALGFVGLDYPEEVAELLETAILAEGEEAEALGFVPSPHEEILGLDYLFALRCLGDQIPADPNLTKRLVKRLADELVHETGSARFRRYRQELEERFEYLSGDDTTSELATSLATALSNDDLGVRWRAAQSLGLLTRTSPEVVTALLAALGDVNGLVRGEAARSLVQLAQTSIEVETMLLASLDDPDSNVSSWAAWSLGRLGQASPEVVTALLATLDDTSAVVRSRAAWSLVQLGQNSVEVVTALLAALDDIEPEVRRQAAWSLGRLGQASPEIVMALLTALDDADFNVRRQAAWSLGRLGQVSPEVVTALLAALDDADSNVRGWAVWSLGRLRQASPEVVTALLVALDDADSNVRGWAAWSLGRLGRGSAEIVTALLAALDDAESNVHHQAAWSLGQLRQASPEVVTALLATLDDADFNVRRQIAWSLGQLGQASPEVGALLLEVLDDADSNVRGWAAWSLGQLGQSSPEMVTALVKVLDDADSSVRGWAAWSLSQLGQSSPEVVTALLATLDDTDSDARGEASWLLGQLTVTPEVVTALLAALDDADSNVCRGAARSLVQLAQTSIEVETALLASLDDPDSNVSSWAAWSLSRLRRTSPEAEAALLVALADPEPDVRARAAESLGELRQASLEVMSSLLAALDDADPNVRGWAAWSLGRLGRASPEVVTALLAALHDADSNVRGWAATGLGQLGEDFPEVVTALLAALEDPEPDVRARAAQSLGRPGQASPEVVTALLVTLEDSDSNVRGEAVWSLGRLGQAFPEVVMALLSALDDADSNVRGWAALGLGDLRQASPDVVTALLAALDDADSNVRGWAVWSLGRLGQASPEVVMTLLAALEDAASSVRGWAVLSLGELGQASPEVMTALLATLEDSAPDVRGRAAESLGKLRQASPEVVTALLAALEDADPDVRGRAAESLGELRQASSEAMIALLAGLNDTAPNVRGQAARGLGRLGQAPAEVVTALLAALKDPKSDVRGRAAQSLTKLDQASPEVVTALVESLWNADSWSVRRDSARLLGEMGAVDEPVILALWRGFQDTDNDVRTACAQALALLGRRFPDTTETIAEKLVQAIIDPAFDEPDRIVKRTGHDYAFDGLWLLMAGGPLSED